MTPRNDSPDGAAGPRIAVAGIGTAGAAVIERLISQGAEASATAVIHTNAQVLAESRALLKVRIGAVGTGKTGAGGDPQAGRLAAEEDYEAIRGSFAHVDLAMLVVGLGKGTGTGAAPLVARAARDQGALVLCFATLPFNFEGELRRQCAAQGIAALREEADAVVVFPNQRLFELMSSGASASDAFLRANETLGAGIQGIWNLLVRPGLMRLDFADLRRVVEASEGTTVFGCADASGEHRAAAAVAAALRSPLLEGGRTVAGAGSLLVSVIGSPDMTLSEIEVAVNEVQAAAPRSARVFMGAAVHPEWKDRVAVTILASERWTGERVSGGAAEASPTAEEPAAHKKKRGVKPLQTQLALDAAGVQRFKGVSPTIYEGEDLDIPTFRRRGIAIEGQ